MSLLHPRFFIKNWQYLPPTGLGAAQIAVLPAGTSSIRLTWTNRRPEYYTNIWFSNGQYINFVGPGVTTYDVIGLAPNTSYSFYVTHSDGQGRYLSKPSNIASAATQIAFNPPTSVTATQRGDLPAGTSTIRLTWANAQAGDPIEVFRDEAYVGLLGPGTTAWDDTGLAPSSTHSYFLRHYRSTASGAYDTPNSNRTSASTQEKFDAPYGLTISNVLSYPAGTSQLALNWGNAQAGDQIQIYRYQNSWNYLTTVPAGTTSYVDSGLAPGTYYYYYLVHIRNGYTSGLIQAGPVSTHAPMPSPVNAFVSNVGPSSMNLNWTNGSGSDTVRVWISVAGGGFTPYDYGAGTAGLAFTGLSAGTSYTFAVRHVRYGTESTDPPGQSNWVGTTTPFPAPAAPYNLQVGVPHDQALIVYWANGDGGAQTEVYLNGGGVATVGPGVTQYQINGLTRCTNYTIQLRALKNGVYSGFVSIVGRPRMYVSGGYAQNDGATEYHWYYQGEFDITLQVPGQINYSGFGAGGYGGQGSPDDGVSNTGGGGGGSGGAFLQYDNVEPNGTYHVVTGWLGYAGATTYRDDIAFNGGWGEWGLNERGGNGSYSGGGAGSAYPQYGGGAGFPGGPNNSCGGGGGGGARGGGASSQSGVGAPGGGGFGLPIFGNVGFGGQGGRGPGSGANATYWGSAGAGGGPDGGGGGGATNGGFMVWFPI